MMGCLGGKDYSDLLPLILLFICLYDGNDFLDDLLDDYEKWLPWLLVILCFCDDLVEDVVKNIEEWLPFVFLYYCFCDRGC